MKEASGLAEYFFRSVPSVGQNDWLGPCHAKAGALRLAGAQGVCRDAPLKEEIILGHELYQWAISKLLQVLLGPKVVGLACMEVFHQSRSNGGGKDCWLQNQCSLSFFSHSVLRFQGQGVSLVVLSMRHIRELQVKPGKEQSLGGLMLIQVAGGLQLLQILVICDD